MRMSYNMDECCSRHRETEAVSRVIVQQRLGRARTMPGIAFTR